MSPSMKSRPSPPMMSGGKSHPNAVPAIAAFKYSIPQTYPRRPSHVKEVFEP